MAFITVSPLRRLPSNVNTTTSSSSRISPTCSTPRFSRRSLLRVAALTASATLLADSAMAFSLADGKVKDAIADVKNGRKHAVQLREEVNQIRKFSEEDGVMVLRFIAIWLEPPRANVANMVTLPKSVSIGDRAQYGVVADTFLGHLVEMRAEAKRPNKEGVIRELDEYIETVDNFLKIAELKRFM